MRYIEPEMEFVIFGENIRTDTITDSTGQLPWVPEPSSVEMENVSI